MKKQQFARWYVYQLVDPRTDEIFYVGKGTGNRIDAHEKDALRNGQVCSKKISKIKDIHNSGLKVEKRFNAFFWDEQAAYDHETEVIAEIGLENLTNILPGGQGAWEKRQADLTERKAKQASRQMMAWVFSPAGSRVLELFANWFRFGGHDGTKISLKTTEKSLAMNAMVTEAFYNAFIPSLFKDISGSDVYRKKLAEAMKPYNVELNHGCA